MKTGDKKCEPENIPSEFFVFLNARMVAPRLAMRWKSNWEEPLYLELLIAEWYALLTSPLKIDFAVFISISSSPWLMQFRFKFYSINTF